MIDALRRSSFFAGFDDQSLGDIAAFARRVTFEAGQIIFDRDEEGRTAYIILTGRVRQGLEVSPGNDVWFLTGEPGDLFGFGSLLPPRVRALRAKASEHSELIALDAVELLEYLEAHPRFGFLFMERLAQVIYQRLNNSRLQIMHLMPDREAAGPTLDRG
jgi:CRP-like cAMP-binding protein